MHARPAALRPGRASRPSRGEKGFTLIELLVVVTIIGILAAIVSVSVGGFTGKASVQAHKATITAVQAAVDAYIADHYSGSGAVVPPTGEDKTIGAAAFTGYYDTNGVVQATSANATVFRMVSVNFLTTSTTTVIANTTRTHGPYLRLGGNVVLVCVFKDNSNNASGGSDPSGEWRVTLCGDSAQTAQ